LFIDFASKGIDPVPIAGPGTVGVTFNPGPWQVIEKGISRPIVPTQIPTGQAKCTITASGRNAAIFLARRWRLIRKPGNRW
jgi:hypothetical protein